MGKTEQGLLLFMLLSAGLMEVFWGEWCESQTVRRGWSLLTDKMGKSVPVEGTACTNIPRPGDPLKARQPPGRARASGWGGAGRV